MLLAPTPGVSRRVPRAAEGAGRVAGRALPKGLRRAQDGAGGARDPSLSPSILPFPPPRGWSLPWAAPPAPPRSVTPVRAPPPVSAGRSWGRVLPYLRRSPSTRPHPARPRDARVRAGAVGGEGGGVPRAVPGPGRGEAAGAGRPGAGVPGAARGGGRGMPARPLEMLGSGGVPAGWGRGWLVAVRSVCWKQ